MMFLKYLYYFLLSWALSLIVSGCGSASETTNSQGLYGSVIDKNNTPLYNAVIRVYTRSDTTVFDSVRSDIHGHYIFTQLSSGIYTIVASYDENRLMARRNSVNYVRSSFTYDIGVDTLFAPGGVLGKVSVINGQPSDVLVLIPGTSYVINPDTLGKFFIYPLPKDTYQIRIKPLSDLYETIKRTVVIIPGDTVQLPLVTIEYDTLQPPPPPEAVYARYDSISSVVTLIWQPVPVADISGYRIFQIDTNGKAVCISESIITDTNFYDTITRTDYSSTSTSLFYKVTSIDKSMNESTTGSPVISVKLPALPENHNVWVKRKNMLYGGITTACGIFNGKGLIIAPVTTDTGLPRYSILSYSFSDDTWEVETMLPVNRKYAAAALWKDSILISGGLNESGVPQNTIDIYNLTEKKWSTFSTSYTYPYSKHTMVTSIKGVFCIGGSNGKVISLCKFINLIDNRFESSTSLNESRELFSSVSSGDTLIIAGGSNDFNQIFSTVILKGSSDLPWVTLTQLPVPRSQHSSVLSGNFLFIFGGFDGNTVIDRVDMLNVENNTWSQKKPLSEARKNCAALTYKGAMYVFGGEGPDAGLLKSVEMYIP